MKNWFLRMLKSVATGVVAKIIVTFIIALPPIAGAISIIQKGKWEIPVWMWIVSGTLLALIGIMVLIVKRIQNLGQENKRYPLIGFVRPYGGWEDYGHYEYKGVKWRIRKGSEGPFRRGLEEESIESILKKIDVQTPPLCPVCQTELEEEKDFWGTSLWGKYVWECINCGFKVRSKERFNESVDKVKIIVRGKIRRA